jgi:hypothetical protein
MRLNRALILGTLTLAIAGCDLSGTYEKRFAASLESVGARAALDALLAPQAKTASPSTLSLRLPTSIDNESATQLKSSDPTFNPPFVSIPGLTTSIERLLDDDAGKFAAAYCYLGAVPKGDKKAVDVQAEVQKQVGTALAGANWQDVQLGPGLAGKLLSVSGQQDFQTADAKGARAVAKLDGQFDLYFCESGTQFVFIGFRAPKGQAAKYGLFEAAKAAVGTAKAS